MSKYDVIVIGVGSMGSATCYELARRGVKVLGLERFSIPHSMGAHGGMSRIIRMAYFEHPDYVPLLQHAYAKWAQLEKDFGRKVFHRVGGLYLGAPDSIVVGNSRLAAEKYNLEHEILTRDEAQSRFPMFNIPQGFIGMIEPTMGFLVPEVAICGFVEQALQHGADIHGCEAVLDWASTGNGVTVRTERDTYRADRLVIAGGPWANRLVQGLGVELTVTRQVMGWVWPKEPALFEYGRCPAWNIQTERGGVHYGFPMMHDRPGFKLAWHYPADPVDPETVARHVQPGDEDTFRYALRNYIPKADGPTLSIEVCLYTNSPDGHFIIDKHPKHENVTVGCGFSGHGFKFAAGIGDIMADLASTGRTDKPVEFLGLKRFK